MPEPQSPMPRGGRRPPGKTGDCPRKPNCVSTEANDPARAVRPIRLKGDPDAAWAVLVEILSTLPRTKIVESHDGYLRAQCRSALFGFIDDLEISLDRGHGTLSLRSAARTGYFDFGVNRRRIEYLRSRLQTRGLAD